jgi:hypothetical protein
MYKTVSPPIKSAASVTTANPAFILSAEQANESSFTSDDKKEDPRVWGTLLDTIKHSTPSNMSAACGIETTTPVKMPHHRTGLSQVFQDLKLDDYKWAIKEIESPATAIFGQQHTELKAELAAKVTNSTETRFTPAIIGHQRTMSKPKPAVWAQEQSIPTAKVDESRSVDSLLKSRPGLRASRFAHEDVTTFTSGYGRTMNFRPNPYGSASPSNFDSHKSGKSSGHFKFTTQSNSTAESLKQENVPLTRSMPQDFQSSISNLSLSPDSRHPLSPRRQGNEQAEIRNRLNKSLWNRENFPNN